MDIPRPPLVPVTITLVGAYLAWFGAHYWRSTVAWPTDPIKAVLTGKGLPPATKESPPSITNLSAYVGGTSSPGVLVTTGGSGGSAIATDAMKYVGAGYVFGGNASAVGDWDCSSFVSKVLGQDLGISLPGGGRWGQAGYPPGSHGPTTLDYMLYGQGIELADVQAGDLIVSTEHIGIAISPMQMVSAQSEATGTGVSGFPAGFPAGPPIYRRVTAGAGTSGGTGAV